MATVKKPSLRQTAGASQETQQVKAKETYSVFYFHRHQPEQIHMFSIDAADACAAEDIACRELDNITVLSVCTEDAARQMPQYPSARFINGRFEPVSYSEDLRHLKFAD